MNRAIRPLAAGSLPGPPAGLRSLLLVSCLLMACHSAEAQDSDPERDGSPVVSSSLTGLQVEPTYLWRPGDVAAWAAPRSDGHQEGWHRQDRAAFPDDWVGIGWFRFVVTVEERLHDTPVGVDLRQVGAAEIYVDGEKVHSWGTVGISPADDVPDRTGDPRPIVFHADPGSRSESSLDATGADRRHLVAVRYSSRFLHELRWRGVEPDLSVHFTPLRPAVERRVDLVHKLSRHQMFLAGVALAFGLVHLMLFVFRPRVGPNVFFAVLALAAAVHVYLNFGRFVQKDPLRFHTLQFYQLVSFLVVGLASLRFLYSILYEKRPWPFPAFAGVALPLAVWAAVTPFAAEPWCYVFMLAINLEIVRAVSSCWWQGRRPLVRGAWVVGLGATPLVVLSIYQLLAGLDLLPTLWSFIDFPAPYYGMVFLMFSMSIYLGRDFARTQSRLERELVRVQQLSAEKLAQEQLTREKEVERARLEAENSRRAAELEEARRIQMAMLPREIPTPPGLELAVHLETATEVGGDYYDFLPSESGELTLVVGDATGHGAQAGTVVAVTKGILRSGDDPSPRQCLERISQGLRQIGLRRRHMALVAARFSPDGRRVVLSAAAMPPVLLYRPGTEGHGDTEAQVASIEFQSLPLGSMASDRYEEKELDLEVGDRLVFLSDGLPEARDASGRPVGYPRVEGAVLEYGHRPPQELIEELLRLVDRQAGSRPDDDLTLVVVGLIP